MYIAQEADSGVELTRTTTLKVVDRENLLMCGICGIAFTDPTREVPEDRLRRMRAAIAHRGPDGQGERRSHGVGLGHVRLSIIDVAGGAQPLSNEDGSVWITYNGEIYNYLGLMERRGYEPLHAVVSLPAWRRPWILWRASRRL